MKRLFIILGALLMPLLIGSRLQAEPVNTNVKYQAVMRDAQGYVQPNKTLTLTLRLVASSAVVYEETQTTTTDALGQINVTLGTGTPTPGYDYSAIDWSQSMTLNVYDGNTLLASNPVSAVPAANFAKSAQNMNGKTFDDNLEPSPANYYSSAKMASMVQSGQTGQTALAKEIAMRESEDLRLLDSIMAERAARIDRDDWLLDSINALALKAKGDVADVLAKLATEIQNRKDEDIRVLDSVAAEKARAIAYEAILLGMINTETSTREAEDAKLVDSIKVERLAREGRDAWLLDSINALALKGSGDYSALIAKLNAEITARENGDKALYDSIDVVVANLVAESAARVERDNWLLDSINALALKSGTDYTTLLTKLNTEITTREAEDLKLLDSIRTEKARAIAYEAFLLDSINALAAKGSDDVSDLAAALAQEILDRQAGDNTLTKLVQDTAAYFNKRLTDEATARESRDTYLLDSINALATSKNAAVTALYDSITRVSNREKATDADLYSKLETEATTREAEDGKLLDSIKVEKIAREEKDNWLLDSINALALKGNGDLEAEIAARKAGDKFLQDSIDAVVALLNQEKVDRGDKDQWLLDSINALALKGNGDLAAEKAAREAGDKYLNDSIDAVAALLAEEVMDRESDVTALYDSITRVSVREVADKAELNTKIGNEQTARESEDAKLLDSVRVERAAREGKDAWLLDSINSLATRMGVSVDDLLAKLTREAFVRDSMDKELYDTIVLKETERKAEDTRIWDTIATLKKGLSDVNFCEAGDPEHGIYTAAIPVYSEEEHVGLFTMPELKVLKPTTDCDIFTMIPMHTSLDRSFKTRVLVYNTNEDVESPIDVYVPVGFDGMDVFVDNYLIDEAAVYHTYDVLVFEIEYYKISDTKGYMYVTLVRE